MNLLEKELPHTGGSNYGDYYYDRLGNPAGASKPGFFSNKLYEDSNKIQIDTVPVVSSTQTQIPPTPQNLLTTIPDISTPLISTPIGIPTMNTRQNIISAPISPMGTQQEKFTNMSVSRFPETPRINLPRNSPQPIP